MQTINELQSVFILNLESCITRPPLRRESKRRTRNARFKIQNANIARTTIILHFAFCILNYRLPPLHWWRTVFYLIPAIALYTIVLGTLSLTSSLFQKTGYFAHWCARMWSRLILATTSA